MLLYKTIRSFHPTLNYLQVYSVNGETYPKTKERPWPNMPQPFVSQRPMGDWLPDPPFTHLTVKNLDWTYNPFCFNTARCRIGLLRVCIQALYTNFFASRQRKLLVFRRSGFGTTRSTLTPIRQSLLTTASIVLPTRILPLLAIAKAPQRRFGVSPATTITSRLSPQRLSLGIPNSFDLTYSSRLSRLVQSIYTEFLLFSL